MKLGPHCIILAGGLGTRLKSVLPDRPKCLAPIGDGTFLERQLLFLSASGIDRFTLSLGFGHLLVKQEIDRLTERYSLHIDSVVEDRQLGTGGAVLNAMASLDLHEAIVVNGDTFLDGNLDDMLAPLLQEGGGKEMIRMALVEVEDSTRFGGVNLKNGRVLSFTEKGFAQNRLINAGVYHLTDKIFVSRAVGSNFSLESDIFPKFAVAGMISGCLINGCFIDIGVPEDYFKFCEMHKSH